MATPCTMTKNPTQDDSGATTPLHKAVQFKATSPDLILNAGIYKEQYQSGLELGIEMILNYPDQREFGSSWAASPQTRLLNSELKTK